MYVCTNTQTKKNIVSINSYRMIMFSNIMIINRLSFSAYIAPIVTKFLVPANVSIELIH